MLRLARPRSCLRSLLTVLALSLALPTVSACRPRTSVREPFDQNAAEAYAAKLEKWLKKRPDDHAARLELGIVYWTHLASTDRARPHLQRVADETGHPLARFALATIAQTRLEVDVVWQQASALIREAPGQKDRRARRLALALSAPAARLIDAIQGQRPGDEQEFIDLFTAIDPAIVDGAYPAEAVQELISTRASIARTRNEPYRELYRRQGCVQDWQVGVLEGYRGPLELERLAIDGGFRGDPEATLSTSLSCAVRLWNPKPEAGIRRMRAVVDVPAEGEGTAKGPDARLRLDLSAQFPTRVLVDGKEVWASDRTDRYPIENPVVILHVAPGEHLLEVRTTIPGEKAWVLVRASDVQGRPLEITAKAERTSSDDGSLDGEPELEIQPWHAAAPEFGLKGQVYAPLLDFLALDDALADGDSDRAESVALAMRMTPDASEYDVAPQPGSADRFAEAHMLLAEFELRDPSRGRSTSSARQQAELERALALDPGLDRARLALLSVLLERGDAAEVVEKLEALPPDQLEGLSGAMLSYDAYRARGSDLQAEQALARAAKIHPQNCDVLMAQRDLARERSQVGREDELTAALTKCPGTLGLRATLAQQRQRIPEAIALYTEKLERAPDEIDSMVALAALAIAAGQWDDAIAWHEKMLAMAPYRAVSRLALADLHARANRPKEAREQLGLALGQLPENPRLHEIAEHLGMPDELMNWRVAGADAVASYRAALANAEVPEGVSEVMLLDRQVSILYPTGGHRHIVHQMFHILSDQAIDAHGEFNQPGVRLLTLHSIKPDGRVIEPEVIQGKEGVSLRDLEIGDIVEVEFSYSQSPDPALPGFFDLGRFRFQSPEIPFHRSELIVLVPQSMEGKVAVERRNAAPQAQRRAVELREGAYTELTFRAERVPRLGTEPNSRSMLDELPMVQVHSRMNVRDWLDGLAGQIRPAQRSNPELRAKALELAAPYESTYDKVDAMWRWVMAEVEEAGDITTAATLTLAGRQGNRLMLLRAMFEQVGIESELWLLKDEYGPTVLPEGDPLVSSYDTVILAVNQGEGKPPLLVSTASEVIPLGYLAPSYAGGKGLRVQLERDEGESGEIAVPDQMPKHRDRRRWDLEITVDAQGAGKVRGVLELTGIEAIQWRDAFDQIDEDRRPEVFIQAELARIIPGSGMDLDVLEVENEWDLELPLRMKFAAHGRNLGVVQSGQLALLAAAVPIDQATMYVRLPERWSGLVIPYAPRLEAKVKYVLDGRQFASVPGDVAIEGEFGGYGRKLTAGGVGKSELVFESWSTLDLGIVEVEEYGGLMRFAAQVQQAEQAILRAK
jgi:tetratricopeptide (TPR) repeat protein